MNNLARAERNAFNADLARLYADEEAAEKRDIAVEDSLKYKLDEALNDESIFETLDHDYEIVQAYKGQIMRALRNLDRAIKGDQVSQDAVFTSLHNIQDNLKRILNIQIKTELGD